MGWNRLPQSATPGEQSEQDAAIITWWEICSDAGMRLEQYEPCYRAAQQRKTELLRQGQQLSIVTPHDLCAELENVRRMHAEIDKSRLLPENAAAACDRCLGKGFEEMPDGTVKKGCDHRPLTMEERKERMERGAAFIREAMRTFAQPMPQEPKAEVRAEMGVTLRCTDCGREVSTLMGFRVGGQCKARVPGPVRLDLDERLECQGKVVNW